MVADIASGEVDVADVLFLIAVILFVVYAVLGLVDTITARVPQLLLGFGLAATALAWLVL